MLPIRLRHFLPVVFFGITLFAEETSPTIQLFNDLKTVEGINKKFSIGLPTIINYQLQGGYFNMPSARTFDAGILGFGSAYVPPTHIWSLAFQFFNHLETTANYFGFSEFANRAANVKLVVFRKDKGSAFFTQFGVWGQ